MRSVAWYLAEAFRLAVTAAWVVGMITVLTAIAPERVP